MAVKKFYLDTSVFIAAFNKKDTGHKALTKFLKSLERAREVQIFYSKWALAEMSNRLTKNQIAELKIVNYAKDILDKNKLCGIKLKQVDVSQKEGYDFHEFFSDLGKDLVKYKTGKERPGLGDIIHIRIMKNNRINTIVTFDKHFEEVPGLICINPLQLIMQQQNENNKEIHTN